MGELRRVFKPEFLNRVDDIIVFHSLKEEEIKKIAENMLGTLIERMRQNGINVEFSKDTLEMLVKKALTRHTGKTAAQGNTKQNRGFSCGANA